MATTALSVVGSGLGYLAFASKRYLWPFLRERPQIYYPRNENMEKIVKMCPVLYDENFVFEPTPYLFNGHLQTIGGSLIRSNPTTITYRREELELSDGGKVSLDWVDPKPDVTPTLTILILHGLTGGSQESYIRHFIVEASKKNWRCVVFNMRGAADTVLHTPLGYCAAYTTDLREVVQHVSSQITNPLVSLGFSLGANIMTKYLGEEGDKTPIRAAVSVSNPIDLYQGSAALEESLFNYHVYNKTFAKNLIRYAKRHYEMFKTSEVIDIDHVINNSKTLRQFDDNATRKLFGYNSVDEYYKAGSSRHFLKGVKVPLVLLTALDDPIVPPRCVPYQEVEESSHVILMTTKWGGHVSCNNLKRTWKSDFEIGMQGWNLKSSFMDEVCVEFFGAIDESVNKKD